MSRRSFDSDCPPVATAPRTLCERSPQAVANIKSTINATPTPFSARACFPGSSARPREARERGTSERVQPEADGPPPVGTAGRGPPRHLSGRGFRQQRFDAFA
jgi:hypothetical protein